MTGRPEHQDSERPKPGQCSCEYEIRIMELNVDRRDIPITAYQRMIEHCPVHGKKKAAS